MLIQWLLPFASASFSELCGSNLASIRMRAVTAADSIQHSNRGSVRFGETLDSKVSVLVIGKIGADCGSGRDERWVEIVRRAKESGSRVILDYTDHHLGFDSSMSKFYSAVLPLIDHSVVPSSHMRELLREHWHGVTTVIPDPIEVEPRRVNLSQGPARRLLWFGHSTNVPYLINFLETARLSGELELWALSNQHGAQAIHQFMARKGLRGRIGQWTLEQMQTWANECQACIIPSDPGDPRKAGASTNRLITALAMGLPTGADLLASYKEYRPFFANLKTDEFAELLARPSGYQAVIERAHREVIPMFNRRHVGEQWASLLKSLF